ncbi:MAG: exo-beta-N-acetylmuramidase NamZ domain-containing protein [Chryseotalea sp.]
MIRILLSAILFAACQSASSQKNTAEGPKPAKIVKVGAEQLDVVLPKLKNKRVALVVNHTSLVGHTHLVDTLLASGIHVVKVFGPEHGFRGNAADGQTITDSLDTKTKLPVLSLYGKTKKPTPNHLKNIDLVIFDIQDVGTRFYTYISTMHYVLEACAEQGVKVLVLDRPNPNDFIDGPFNRKPLQSFVAMHAIPAVHGLTVGELATMINEEKWLANGVRCDVEIIKVKGWQHGQPYVLPVKPSPNLPNQQAVNLYPSLCFFEGTVISIGRGTPFPFQVAGNPLLTTYSFSFVPNTIAGVAVKPPHENKTCYGLDLRTAKAERRINLKYLLELFKAYPEKEKFFTDYINLLAGNPEFKNDVLAGKTEEEIRATWQKELDAYKTLRKKYVLYPEANH